MNRLNLVVALATLTAVTPFAHADAQATAATGRGDIHGLVVNAASQTPIANAEIDVTIGSDPARASGRPDFLQDRFASRVVRERVLSSYFSRRLTTQR